MKRHWIIWLLAFVVGAACSGRRSQGLLLDKADSLVAVKPDSALRLLEHLPVRSLHTEEERARYALLLTEARDRCYVVQTDDSLIRTAVDYYDAQGDVGMRARAYYRWGSVLRDKKEQARAVEKYLEAVDLAKETGDKGLQGKIYANLGFLYYHQDFWHKADSFYRLAEARGLEVGDTLLVADALSTRGRICFAAKEYSRAKHLLWAADSILGKDNSGIWAYDGIRANICAYMSMISAKEHDYLQAINYARRNILLQEDTLHCYRAFMFLGDAYYRAGIYDSAVVWFEKCRESQLNSVKQSAYMRLSSIAQVQGNLDLALALREKSVLYKDSMNLSSHARELQRAERNFLLDRQKDIHVNHVRQILFYVAIFSLIVLISAILYRKRVSRNTSRLSTAYFAQNAENVRLKNELLAKDNQIGVLETKLAQVETMDEERAALRKELKNLYNQRQALQSEIKANAEVYVKIERILQDYKDKGYSKDSLTEEDWLQLAVKLDANGILLDWAISLGLSVDEKRYCLLLLADYSVGDRCRIFHISRQTPYRWEKEICRKMGIGYQAGVLKQVVSDKIRGGKLSNVFLR